MNRHPELHTERINQEGADTMETTQQREPRVADLLARIEGLEGQARAMRDRRGRLRRLLTPVVAIGVVVALTGVAHAAIGNGGVITGCYTQASVQGQHALTLIDTVAGTKCTSRQTTLTWNQTGPQGLKGDTGASGASGAAGPQGLKGDSGAAGPQGLKGDSGAAGPQGLKGDTGASGASGAAGPQGPSGVSGYQIIVFDGSVLDLTDDSFSVHCPDGKLALGGGIEDVTRPNGLYVKASYPLAGGSGWGVVVHNTGDFAETEDVRAYAICANVT